ncbi:hypothetical protein AAE02nite_32190 [Adhaeribacter aerolatus]|uniref:Uncharacterized protein n=1 Tax=Adhaeribacter aerolatus TaxID=670289 RepID=A0A512B0R9_9BACT|nr:hypothetical protein [Adhaeribacter aerolatus]GEO05555.1 hypothetical protein AAE02nite_32190 [Adhaeribacter aerolatus]
MPAKKKIKRIRKRREIVPEEPSLPEYLKILIGMTVLEAADFMGFEKHIILKLIRKKNKNASLLSIVTQEHISCFKYEFESYLNASKESKYPQKHEAKPLEVPPAYYAKIFYTPHPKQ